jgi:hypothetical protein
MALRSDRLDPICERLHELLQEFAGAVADELAVLIEELVGMTEASGCCMVGTFRNTSDCVRDYWRRRLRSRPASH